MNRQFIAANDLLLHSFRLAVTVAEAGFKPDFLVGLWRGGSAVGIAVQEGLEHFGISTDHIAIRTSYAGPEAYSARTRKEGSIRVHGLQYLLENLSSKHSMLIVDDVYSSGDSVNAVIEQLRGKTRRNMPHDIRTASVWYRPTDDSTRVPDYYVFETHDWLVLPYELSGLTMDEIHEHKPALGAIVADLQIK